MYSGNRSLQFNSPDSVGSLSGPVAKRIRGHEDHFQASSLPKSQGRRLHPDRLNDAAKAIMDRHGEIEYWSSGKKDEEIDEIIQDDEMYLDAAIKFECVQILR